VVEIRNGVVHFAPLSRGLGYQHATAREVIGHWRKTGRTGPGRADEPGEPDHPAVSRAQLSLGLHT
jgi:hypothetical protein